VPCGAPSADQRQRVLALLHEDRKQDALRRRKADDARVLGLALILDDEGQRVQEGRGGLLEGDAVLARVRVGLGLVPTRNARA